jgi:hypothetical protein
VVDAKNRKGTSALTNHVIPISASKGHPNHNVVTTVPQPSMATRVQEATSVM